MPFCVRLAAKARKWLVSGKGRVMRKWCFGVAVSAALLSAPSVVFAADLAPACDHGWSGVYAGVDGGYQAGKADVSFHDGVDMDGIIGGGLAGWNYQMCEFLMGIEADIGFSDVHGGSSNTGIGDFKLEPNGHLRARLGLPLGSVMPFVAAGLAIAGGDLRIDFEPPSDSQTHLGFSAGAGIDLRMMDHLLLRGEYLYDSYDSQTYRNLFDHVLDLDSLTVRAAVIWQF